MTWYRDYPHTCLDGLGKTMTITSVRVNVLVEIQTGHLPQTDALHYWDTTCSLFDLCHYDKCIPLSKVYFNTLFPAKTFYLNKNKNNKWITKGLLVFRNKLRILNDLKRSTQISVELWCYINKYQLIYKNLLKEAKKKKWKTIHSFCPQKIKPREYGR